MCHARDQLQELSASASRRRPQLIIERTTSAEGEVEDANRNPPHPLPIAPGVEVIEKVAAAPAPAPEQPAVSRDVVDVGSNEVSSVNDEVEEVVYERMSSRPRPPRKVNFNMIPLRYYLRKLPNEPIELSRVRVLWEAPVVQMSKGTPATPPVRDQVLTHTCGRCEREASAATPMQLDTFDANSSFYSYANPFVGPFSTGAVGLFSNDVKSRFCGEAGGDTLMHLSMDPWYESMKTEIDNSNAMVSATQHGSEYSPFSTCSSYLFGAHENAGNEGGLLSGFGLQGLVGAVNVAPAQSVMT